MDKKYEIFKENESDALYRIRALRNFDDVKAGAVGGFVEGEHNLSHDGNCWIYDIARVFGNALVYGNANVFGNAHVYGNARVYGDSWVSGNARVFGDARVYGKALVFGNASVFGNAHVSEANRVFTGDLTVDITNGLNKLDAIRCGVAGVFVSVDNKEVTCYKKVADDFSSLYDSKFKYEVGEWVEVSDYDADPIVSCSSGLHFAGPEYWYEGSVLLECKVVVDDIIAVQEGKIRAKKTFILRVKRED